MSTHRQLALRIINELMPAGHASNLRLTICKLITCKLMHASGDCDTPSGSMLRVQLVAPKDNLPTPSHLPLEPCERVFIAVIRATIAAFKIGCANNTRACEQFMQQLQRSGIEAEEQILAREANNPTPPRGIAKMDISEECGIAVFLLTTYIVIRNEARQLSYLRELAEALDIHALPAERLIQTAKQAVNEFRITSQRQGKTRAPELMLA